jgi:hypothetical protein
VSHAAAREVTLGQSRIAAGEKVVVWYRSANRDENVFRDPYGTCRQRCHGSSPPVNRRASVQLHQRPEAPARADQLTACTSPAGQRGAHTLGLVDDRKWGVGIRALHAGGRPDPAAGARAVPVCLTASFVFEDSPDAADLFALRRDVSDRRPGIDTAFVPADRSEAFAAAMRAAAKAFSYTAAVRGFVFGIAARDLSQVV